MIISSYNPAFCANFNSPKLKFKQADFFVKIRGYGKNKEWAKTVIETADTAVNLIRNNTSAENILKYITKGVADANLYELSLAKREKTGILRAKRPGWHYVEDTEILTGYEKGRYKSYAQRLDIVEKNPLSEPNLQIGMTRPTGYQDILHGKSIYINNSLDYVFNLCKKLFPKYIKQDIKPGNMDEFNSTVAEIRWVLAHSTPWLRGSDAISNVFMRAIYKAAGIKTYPLAKGVSLDMEAYCTELSEYKKKFPAFFETPPEIIE